MAAIAQEALRPDLGDEVRALHRKLDQIADQVGYLYDRIQAAEELRRELLAISKDGLAALREELQAVEHEFNSDELVHFLRKLLRSTPRFVWMLDRMESFAELVEDLAPLSRELVKGGIEWLDQAEKKGYFQIAKGAASFADRVGESCRQENVQAISANVVRIMDGALRGLDQPSQPLSPWGLWRSLRDPEIQQGLGVVVEVLRRVSREVKATSEKAARASVAATG